ncbi:MAG TPA: 16S rRNA (guanine(527)-N(7))-methyltransferase RsmG [Solirubrobacteraceae bacterium]|jgi:16S rRNA (guanine527-N7)-methyltransferase|nr:16S rRNA (guanine(527)-N(7))-methyltransferase RsmG [Solirubrobacteraceae bacterium]
MTEHDAERFTGNIEGPWAQSLAAFGLGVGQLAQLTSVLAVLERDEHAPTTVRTARAATETHLADSLAGLEIDLIADARVVADLGAGAGFPGVPLAVALPQANIRLVESRRRKCEFLERLLAAAGLGNATAVCVRAEEWGEGMEGNDVVLARALAPQPVVLEYAAPLLRAGGALVDWRGRRDVEQEREAAAAAEVLGMRLREVRPVRPFAQATDRHLHVWLKTAQTPSRFPRRAGMARKRPLGAH